MEDEKRPRGRPTVDRMYKERFNIEEDLALDRGQWRAVTRMPDLPQRVARLMMSCPRYPKIRLKFF